MVACSVCGRELTDPVSVARGIGPECIMGVKSDMLGQRSLFATRAKYDYRIKSNTIVMRDLGGGMSLTNDMENAIQELSEALGGLDGYQIMYRDSFGMWDGVVFKGGRIHFFMIQESEESAAQKKLDKSWKQVYITL